MDDLDTKLHELGYMELFYDYYIKKFKYFDILVCYDGVTLTCPIIDMCRNLPFTDQYIELYKQALHILEDDFKILFKTLMEKKYNNEKVRY